MEHGGGDAQHGEDDRMEEEIAQHGAGDGTAQGIRRMVGGAILIGDETSTYGY
jgi:hypothetical protein